MIIRPVRFDLAPHIDMYRDFSNQAQTAREFFLCYQDRIVYGTDIDTRVLERGPEGYQFMLSIPWLIRSLLEKDDTFETPGGSGIRDWATGGCAPKDLCGQF
jgi:hypothetical protein